MQNRIQSIENKDEIYPSRTIFHYGGWWRDDGTTESIKQRNGVTIVTDCEHLKDRHAPEQSSNDAECLHRWIDDTASARIEPYRSLELEAFDRLTYGFARNLNAMSTPVLDSTETIHHDLAPSSLEESSKAAHARTLSRGGIDELVERKSSTGKRDARKSRLLEKGNRSEE